MNICSLGKPVHVHVHTYTLYIVNTTAHLFTDIDAYI